MGLCHPGFAVDSASWQVLRSQVSRAHHPAGPLGPHSFAPLSSTVNIAEHKRLLSPWMKTSDVFLCVYVCMCVWGELSGNAFVSVCAHMWACTWKPEVDIGVFYHPILEKGSLPEPGPHPLSYTGWPVSPGELPVSASPVLGL